jgi:hypothetical protein
MPAPVAPITFFSLPPVKSTVYPAYTRINNCSALLPYQPVQPQHLKQPESDTPDIYKASLTTTKDDHKKLVIFNGLIKKAAICNDAEAILRITHNNRGFLRIRELVSVLNNVTEICVKQPSIDHLTSSLDLFLELLSRIKFHWKNSPSMFSLNEITSLVSDLKFHNRLEEEFLEEALEVVTRTFTKISEISEFLSVLKHYFLDSPGNFIGKPNTALTLFFQKIAEIAINKNSAAHADFLSEFSFILAIVDIEISSFSVYLEKYMVLNPGSFSFFGFIKSAFYLACFDRTESAHLLVANFSGICRKWAEDELQGDAKYLMLLASVSVLVYFQFNTDQLILPIMKFLSKDFKYEKIPCLILSKFLVTAVSAKLLDEHVCMELHSFCYDLVKNHQRSCDPISKVNLVTVYLWCQTRTPIVNHAMKQGWLVNASPIDQESDETIKQEQINHAVNYIHSRNGYTALLLGTVFSSLLTDAEVDEILFTNIQEIKNPRMLGDLIIMATKKVSVLKKLLPFIERYTQNGLSVYDEQLIVMNNGLLERGWFHEKLLSILKMKLDGRSMMTGIFAESAQCLLKVDCNLVSKDSRRLLLEYFSESVDHAFSVKPEIYVDILVLLEEAGGDGEEAARAAADEKTLKQRKLLVEIGAQVLPGRLTHVNNAYRWKIYCLLLIWGVHSELSRFAIQHVTPTLDVWPIRKFDLTHLQEVLKSLGTEFELESKIPEIMALSPLKPDLVVGKTKSVLVGVDEPARDLLNEENRRFDLLGRLAAKTFEKATGYKTLIASPVDILVLSHETCNKLTS